MNSRLLIITVIVFAIVLVIRYFRTKKETEILTKTDGKHTAEFKINVIKGFVANDVLYFQVMFKNIIHEIEWKQAEYISAGINRFHANGIHMEGYYVKFYDKAGKQVGGIGGTLEFSKRKYVEEFFDFVRQNAEWIEISENK